MKNNIVLFAPIEMANLDKNSINYNMNRNYELEATECFKLFRLNGGWLKDIRIITFCLSKNNLSNDTLKIFSELNIENIHLPNLIKSDIKCGFWNIPILGKYLEKYYYKYNLSKNTKLLKIDLDMFLIKPLPKEWFNYNEVVVATHDNNFHDYLTNLNLNLIFYNTGFVISEIQNYFYTKQYALLNEMERHFKNNTFFKKYNILVKDNINQKKHLEYILLEELCVSYYEKIFNEKLIKLNNFYIELEKEELKNLDDIDSIYFIHEHLNLKFNKTKLILKLKLKKLFEKRNIIGFKHYLKIKG